MKRTLLMLLVLFTSCTEDRLMEFEDCGRPCYTKGNTGLGECRYGYWDCSADEPACVDERFPMPERCNNKDDNCDGQTDENLLRLCENECGEGLEMCERGEWVGCTAREPEPEACNNIDDDCDGEVDEGLITTTPCYPLGFGHESLAHAPCTYGVTSCIDGVESCERAVVPEEEICDGIDNDCDGEMNEGMETRDYDVVVIMDFSGSMSIISEIVTDAVMDFASSYTGGKVRFALVGIAGPYRDAAVDLVLNLSTPAEFADKLGEFDSFVGSLELSIDALVDVCNVEDNPLGLDWALASKKVVIIFTDEMAQSRANQEIELATLYAVANQVRVYVFLNPQYVYDFRDLASVSGGAYYSVNNTEQGIESDLSNIINTFCIE